MLTTVRHSLRIAAGLIGGVSGLIGGLASAAEPLACDEVECCPPGLNPYQLSDGADALLSVAPNRCIVARAGSDTISTYAPGMGAVLCGPGNDTLSVGQGDAQVRGGAGWDTITTADGDDTVLGNSGNDTINTGYGSDYIVPGPGADVVDASAGDDTVVIFDICEVEDWEWLDGSSGYDTLITPVPVPELEAAGAVVTNFENIVVQPQSCLSECAAVPDCGGHGHCVEGDSPGQTDCECDPGYTGPECDDIVDTSCPEGSVKAGEEPGDCGCSQLDTDTDGDGVPNCLDECWLDPDKVEPGQCGCHVPDDDNDLDGVANCLDACPDDPDNVVRGDCGCADEPEPPGTPCHDGVCPGISTCDGQGQCIAPDECHPDADCTVRRFGTHVYWFCEAELNWDEANAACRATPGRHLVSIESQNEQNFIEANIANIDGVEGGWMGANDRLQSGKWRRSRVVDDAGKLFWDADTGERVHGRYENWAEAQPADVGNCAEIGEGVEWRASDCAWTKGFICEQVPTIGPDTDVGADDDSGGGSDDGGGDDCNGPPELCDEDPDEDPDCIPEDEAFPDGWQGFLDDVEACNTACEGTDLDACRDACQGVAEVPVDGSTCPPFTSAEKSHCRINELMPGATCDSETDCCSKEYERLTTVGFDDGPLIFTYADDCCGGSAQPDYASGTWVNLGGQRKGVLQIDLGGVDGSSVADMSGAWSTVINVAKAGELILSFDYELEQSPNYEAGEVSQLWVQIDGQPRGRFGDDHLDEIAGDGNGGTAISTGWTAARVSLGEVEAGDHTISIGAYNNRKTELDESTRLRIDDLYLDRSGDDCEDPWMCGLVGVNPDNTLCDPCELEPGEEDDGKCDRACSQVLRCGAARPRIGPEGEEISCADASNMPELCGQIEICIDPEFDIVVHDLDPAGPDEDPPLADVVFNPEEHFVDDVVDPLERFAEDPPCDLVAHPDGCPVTPEHRWCKYEVGVPKDHLDDNLAPASVPEIVNPLAKRNIYEPNSGSSGSGSPISFHFSPETSLDFEATPLAFGESDFTIGLGAAFAAGATLAIDPIPPLTFDVIYADFSADADRCEVTSRVELTIMEGDFLPLEGGAFKYSSEACRDRLAKYKEAVVRARKAYWDARELLEQYYAVKEAGERFPEDLCQQLVGENELVANFPGDPCPLPPNEPEPAHVTINRFVEHYTKQVKERLVGAKQDLTNAIFERSSSVPGARRNDDKTWSEPLNLGSQRESRTVARANFSLGPVPMLMEIDVYWHYGLGGSIDIKFDPQTLLQAEKRAELAWVEANVGPQAGAGISAFVGAGFDGGGLSVSAGIEGSVSIGEVSLANSVGGGIAVTASRDERPSPVIPEQYTTGDVLFPLSLPLSYHFAMRYKIGSRVEIDDILSGSIAARARVKFLWFSKTWRQLLARFRGFGPKSYELISIDEALGGDLTLPFEDLEGAAWGEIQMPMVLHELKSIPEVDALPPLDGAGFAAPPEAAISTVKSGAFLYEEICGCQEGGNLGIECVNARDCCDPQLVCFRDPVSQEQSCAQCRAFGESCNRDSDCCGQPSEICLDEGICGIPPQ